MTADPLAALAAALARNLVYSDYDGQVLHADSVEALAADGWHLVNRDTLAAAVIAAWDASPDKDYMTNWAWADAILLALTQRQGKIAGRNNAEPGPYAHPAKVGTGSPDQAPGVTTPASPGSATPAHATGCRGSCGKEPCEWLPIKPATRCTFVLPDGSLCGKGPDQHPSEDEPKPPGAHLWRHEPKRAHRLPTTLDVERLARYEGTLALIADGFGPAKEMAAAALAAYATAGESDG